MFLSISVPLSLSLFLFLLLSLSRSLALTTSVYTKLVCPSLPISLTPSSALYPSLTLFPLSPYQVIKKPGGSLADSFLEEGFVLNKSFGVGQPRRFVSFLIYLNLNMYSYNFSSATFRKHSRKKACFYDITRYTFIFYVTVYILFLSFSHFVSLPLFFLSVFLCLFQFFSYFFPHSFLPNPFI